MSETRSLSLRDYVQHKPSCHQLLCAGCGHPKWLHDPAEDLDEVTCGVFAIRKTGCTCGLDDAIRAQEPPQAQLHHAIMNLPLRAESTEYTVHEWGAYKDGHRDARHAAAELVVGDTPVSAERSKT